MKNAHNDFPSDVYISMATVGAVLEIVDHTGAAQQVPVVDFVTMNMKRKFIKTIHFTETRRHEKVAPVLMKVIITASTCDNSFFLLRLDLVV